MSSFKERLAIFYRYKVYFLCTTNPEEPDYIDLFMILKSFSNIEISDVYRMSRLKDAIFDDPPTVAYQLETGIAFIKENPALIPTVLQKIDMKDLYEFYEKLAGWLYALIKK
jgi:hypothetical protein